MKIKWDFLRATVKFWAPEDNVFRFNTAELCPKIEEFYAILGYDPSKKFVAVSCDPRHKESLFDDLGLPTSITDSMIEGHMVNLLGLDAGDNHVSLILAETLLGLDVVFHGGETQNFLGSPLTLQIWLMK